MQPQDNNPPEPQIIKPTIISPTTEPSPVAETPVPVSTSPPTDAPQVTPITPTPITDVPAAMPAPAEPTPPAPTEPAAPVASGGMPPQPIVDSATKPKSLKKILIIIAIIVAVLGGGAAAFYFGYYANPSVVYKQSLSNTSIGYDRLVKYVEDQAGQPTKGYTGSGSYNYTSSGFDSKGTMTFKGDESNAELTLGVGIGPNTVTADLVTIGANAASPEAYFKVGGLDSLSQLLGASGSSYGPALNKLNNAWISVDPSLIDGLTQSSASNTASKPPTNTQIVDEMKAAGKVNKDYLYSTSKDKAVLTVVKKYGVETVDGHKTYHYQVALNKDHVKKYIIAQRDALKASKMADWLKKNGYDGAVYSYFDLMSQSADDIKSSDTFGLWSDMSQRIVYKVRFNDATNPATNYVDLGLNYKGGDDYPFFITAQSKTGKDVTTTNFIASLNTKTGNVGFKLGVKGAGSSSENFTADFNMKPSTNKVTIVKPTGAVPLSQVLQQLGYGDMYNMYIQQLQQQAAASATAAPN